MGTRYDSSQRGGTYQPKRENIERKVVELRRAPPPQNIYIYIYIVKGGRGVSLRMLLRHGAVSTKSAPDQDTSDVHAQHGL